MKKIIKFSYYFLLFNYIIIISIYIYISIYSFSTNLIAIYFFILIRN